MRKWWWVLNLTMLRGIKDFAAYEFEKELTWRFSICWISSSGDLPVALPYLLRWVNRPTQIAIVHRANGPHSIHSKYHWLFGPRPIRAMICRVSGPGPSSEWAVEWMVQNMYLLFISLFPIGSLRHKLASLEDRVSFNEWDLSCALDT